MPIFLKIDTQMKQNNKKEVETILLNVGVQFAVACIYKPK